MSLKIHLKRREKSVKKTVLKKGARLFYFIHPRKSKKVLCVSKSPLLREGMPKRERNIENRNETELFASSAAKVELFGGMLFLFYDYYLEAKAREVCDCCWITLFVSKIHPFCPSRKDPPHHHHHLIGTRKEEKERPNLKNHMFLTYLGTN